MKARAQTRPTLAEVPDRRTSFNHRASGASASFSGLKQWAVLAAILVFFVVLESFLPLATAVKIGADEDFELSKATLVMKGYKLYTQIWNDQPPLNTSLLISLVHHVSPPILGPRLMSVTLALVLVSSFFLMVLRVNGLLVATLATVMLLASPGFIELSSTCMQEIPALAPVVAGLCVFVCFGSAASGSWLRSQISCVLAGLLFGFGLQLKLIGVIYLPLALLIMWLQRRESPGALKYTAISSAIFGATAAACFVGLNFLTGNPLLVQLQQSWAAHFSSAKSFEYGSPADRPFEWAVLLRNWDTTVPALFGAALMVKFLFVPKRQTAARSPAGINYRLFNYQQFGHQLPIAWLALTLVVFTTHRPWWSYYYLHNSVPLCWCAAIALAALWGRLRNEESLLTSAPTIFKRVLGVVFAVAAFSWMGARVYLQETAIRNSPRLDSCLVLKEIARYKPFTTFLFAHDPIYSFHSDIPVPPHLAMISLKRLWSGEMTNARLISELETTKPGLVLMPNEATERPFQDLLNREYRLVYQDGSNLLYAHRSISRKPQS